MKRILFSLLGLALIFGACTKKQDFSEKVLHLQSTAKVKGLDPALTDDRYSGREAARVYEGLLEYHYLKRPFTLQPNLAEAMPTVSEDGFTYTFKIKKGIFFHDNKCFPEGKGRELVAEDFVYSFKRVADPKTQSTGWWVMQSKIEGLDEWREAQAEKGKSDYSADVSGVRALDKYTFQIKLKRPFPQFLYGLAMPFYYVVPREAVEHYGKEFLNHPVGTGPFMLDKFTQTNKITYQRNPKFRDKFYPSEGAEKFKKMGLLKDAGKKIPFVDKVVVHVMTESQPRWLSFLKGKIDFLSIPKDNFDQAVTPSKGMSKDLEAKGMTLLITPSLDVTFSAFNNKHPLFKNNKKLRQAMTLAYNVEGSNNLFYNGTALKAESIIPPGIAGYIPGWKNPLKDGDMKNRIERAKKLLAEAGYPNGKGLPEITYDITANTVARQLGEYFKKEMAQIGVNIKVVQNPWPELQKKVKTASSMMYGMAWGADYPDAENFLQLLYGPNKAPGANGSNYDNPVFNEKFKVASKMQDSPERTKLYEELKKMAADEAPIIFGVHRRIFTLNNRWLKNYIYTDFEHGQEKYLNVDLEEKAQWVKKL